MKLEFSHEFDAPREAVWNAMLDPLVLAQILPGIERFETVGEDEYDVSMKLGIPAVKGDYEGAIKIKDKVELESYVLEGGGKGVQGWARGAANVRFSETGTGTRIEVEADAQIGGRMAGVGQRMIEGVAKMMAEEFFADFEKVLKGDQTRQSGPVAFFFRAVWRSIRRLLGLEKAAA